MPELLRLPGFEISHKGVTETNLRWYQQDAADKAFLDLVGPDPVDSTIVVIFTGGGKTKTATNGIVKRWLKQKRGRVLWLAMRDFLIDQAKEDLERAIGEYVSVEKAQLTASGTNVVVASVQTLQREKRLASWPQDAFTLIVFDEAHHAVASGPMRIFEHFKAKRLGLTATPKRLDKLGMHNAFERVSANYPIRFGIDEGYFVPPRAIARAVKSIDISSYKSNAGDLQLGDIEKEIIKAAGPIAHIAWEESNHGELPTLIYTPGVASARAVSDTWNNLAGVSNCVSVDQDTKKTVRSEYLSKFGKEIRAIANCLVYTEGLDVPLAKCIVIARLTESVSLYEQMFGRGGRPEKGCIEGIESPEERKQAIAKSSKPWFKLVDVTGKHGKHKIISGVDLLSGKDVTDKEKQIAKELIKKSQGIDIDESILEAKRIAAREEKERLEKEAEKIANLAAKSKVVASTKEFDPFSEEDGKPEQDGIPPKWLQQQPTPEQFLWCKENKIYAEGLSRGKVAKLQRQAKEWRRFGKASFRQRNILKKAGLPEDIPSSVAVRLISVLSDNQWKPFKCKRKLDEILSQGRTVGEEG